MYWPSEITFDHYAAIWAQTDFPTLFKNSLINFLDLPGRRRFQSQGGDAAAGGLFHSADAQIEGQPGERFDRLGESREA